MRSLESFTRIKEAEQYAEEDKRRKEEVETLNRADNLIYDLEKQLRDNGEKMTPEDKTTVETEIEDFKKVREGGKADEIKPAMDTMTQKVYEIFGKLYQDQGAAPQDGQPEPEQGPVENPDGSVDVEGEVH